MNHILNILRFLLYLPLCLVLLWAIYQAIGYFAIWVSDLSWLWLILAGLAIFGLGLGLAMYVFGFLAGLLSYINPYKKVGGWIVIPIAIILGIVNIIIIWRVINLNHSRELIAGLMATALIFYLTFTFSILISAKNPKKFLSN